MRGWQRRKKLVWFVEDSEPLWDTVPSQWDPLGHWSSHTPSANLPFFGASPKVGDVETTRASYGVSFLLHTQHPHSLGEQSPLQRKSHHLLFLPAPISGVGLQPCWWSRNAFISPSSLIWRMVRKKTQGSKSRLSSLAHLIA